MKNFFVSLLFVSLFMGSGCVFVNSSTISDSPNATDPHEIQAIEEGSLGVLHLTAPNDLTVLADEKLLAECPSGHVENVQTQLSERDYFLIVQSYRLQVNGRCITPKPVAAAVAPPPEAKETSRGLVFTLGNILFDTNKATVKHDADKNLEKLVQYLKEEPSRKIMIEGYTDNTGRASWNQVLSENRAENIEAALVDMGLSKDRIASVKGFGAQFPVSSNETAEGRQENRRVEIVISDEKGTFPESR